MLSHRIYCACSAIAPASTESVSGRPSQNTPPPTPHATVNNMKSTTKSLAMLVAVLCPGKLTAFVLPSGAFLAKNLQISQVASSIDASASSPVHATRMSVGGVDKTMKDAGRTLATFFAGATVFLAGADAALADGSTSKFSLPPVSQAKDRCEFKSSAMGQANAARDKLYDLRECNLRFVLLVFLSVSTGCACFGGAWSGRFVVCVVLAIIVVFAVKSSVYDTCS